jgi:hypothetical protein
MVMTLVHELIFVGMFVFILVLLVWGLVQQDNFKEARKKNIEFGMFNSKSIVYYIVESRKNRRLIDKYNKLHAAVRVYLSGFPPEDVVEWLTAHGLTPQEFTEEFYDSSTKIVVEENAVETRKHIKRHFKI